MIKNETGAIGWVLLWALGIPIPILLVLFMLRGCTLFSMAPLLMIAIAVAGLVFGQEASQNQVIGIIEDLVEVQGARAIQEIIESAGQRPDAGFFATAVGMILLLLGAAGVSRAAARLA